MFWSFIVTISAPSQSKVAHLRQNHLCNADVLVKGVGVCFRPKISVSGIFNNLCSLSCNESLAIGLLTHARMLPDFLRMVNNDVVIAKNHVYEIQKAVLFGLYGPDDWSFVFLINKFKWKRCPFLSSQTSTCESGMATNDEVHSVTCYQRSYSEPIVCFYISTQNIIHAFSAHNCIKSHRDFAVVIIEIGVGNEVRMDIRWCRANIT